MRELRADESVGVMMVVGGGRLDVLCREVAAMGREFALLCDERGPIGVVRVEAESGAA